MSYSTLTSPPHLYVRWSELVRRSGPSSSSKYSGPGSSICRVEDALVVLAPEVEVDLGPAEPVGRRLEPDVDGQVGRLQVDRHTGGEQRSVDHP